MRRIQVEWSLLIVLALFAAGCESGFSTHFHFSVGPDTTEAFSEENPGLLFMSNGDHLTPVAQLCSADALNLSVDIDGGADSRAVGCRSILLPAKGRGAVSGSAARHAHPR